MTRITLLLACLILVFSGHAQKKQGIRGKVLWVSGNQMPGPGKTANSGKGIKRIIHIYDATTLSETDQNGVFFSNVKTHLAKKVKSNAKGKFCTKLPPGEYSIFVEEKDGLFANLFDSSNRIHIVTVKSGIFTEITIQVNYEAAY